VDREVKEAMAHLLVCLGARGGDRRGLVDGSRERRRGLNGDEVALVTDWQRKEAKVLHGVEAKLARGSWRLGKVESGGSTADSARRR